MKNILITEKKLYEQKIIKKINKKKFKIFYLKNENSQKEFLALNKKYRFEIIFTKLGLNINKKLLLLNNNLKYVLTPTTGTNHIVTNNNIKIISLKNEKKLLNNISSTAEHGWSLLLNSVRNTHLHNLILSNNKWTRNSDFEISQLKNKKIGIIGFGRLGKIIAKYAQSFEMKIFYNDLKKINTRFTYLSLNKILNESDFVFLTVNYNNKILLTREILQKIKKPIDTFINISRGELIEEKELCKIIEVKKIINYYTDVLNKDSAWNSYEYKKNPIYLLSKKYKKRIFITPHIGGYSKEAISLTRDFILKKALNSILK